MVLLNAFLETLAYVLFAYVWHKSYLGEFFSNCIKFILEFTYFIRKSWSKFILSKILKIRFSYIFILNIMVGIANAIEFRIMFKVRVA